MARNSRHQWVMVGIVAICSLALVNTVLTCLAFRQSRNCMKGIKKMRRNTERLRNEVFSALLAEKVETVVAGARTDQEKCLRIARWIAGHISNREVSEDVPASYVHRSGMCDKRVMLFIRMLSFLHIPGRVFNLYNFGGVGNGHSCAQAYYSGQWHFFDVTYAGVFVRDGKVLSWNEIKTAPENAVKNMIVFEETLDRLWLSKDSSGRYGYSSEDPVERKKVDNKRRMHINYSVDNIRQARSFGFLGYPDVKTIYPSVDTAQIKDALKIGRLDGCYTDVSSKGITMGISEQLGTSLGTAVDTFHVTWEFRNCQPGKAYALRYYLYGATHAGLKYWAKSKDAIITRGLTFTSTKSPLALRSAVWEIHFRPKKGGFCSIELGYDFREKKRLLYVDQIQILAISKN